MHHLRSLIWKTWPNWSSHFIINNWNQQSQTQVYHWVYQHSYVWVCCGCSFEDCLRTVVCHPLWASDLPLNGGSFGPCIDSFCLTHLKRFQDQSIAVWRAINFGKKVCWYWTNIIALKIVHIFIIKKAAINQYGADHDGQLSITPAIV